MKLLVKKLCLSVHRMLCYVGIHASERVFKIGPEPHDFVPDGWFCDVCSKTWEEEEK
ncbi:hypothetical protein LCGC14_0455240 [marine sediment metagenome]|uniref:Uncharacterized protein n=1 Tax=marine sediment metagenome TaxID=412755 RepID=A0A0F9SGP8_9ZZZZ